MSRLEALFWAAVIGLPALCLLVVGMVKVATAGVPHRMGGSTGHYESDGGVEDDA